MKSYRKIKVGWRSIPYMEFELTKYNKVPMISLSGNWLREAGFDVSDPVDVFVSKDMIVLKKNIAEIE